MEKNKLPTSNGIYWAMLLSACTMGETLGDYISFGLKFGYGYASVTLIALLLIALIVEAKAKVQSEVRYWTTIVIMSTTGTAMADFLTRTLKLGYGRGSALLTTMFAVIYFVERINKSKASPKASDTNETLLPYIKTKSLPATDAFYWAAILVASTFGTTMGDFVSNGLGLGFGGGSLLLGGLFAIVLTAEFRAKVTNKPRYWAALVIASTIGATTGDFLTKEDALNLGYGWGAVILIAVFAVIFFIGRHLVPTTSTEPTFADDSVFSKADFD